MISKSEPAEPASPGAGSNEEIFIAKCTIADCTISYFVRWSELMHPERVKLSERLLNFGASVIKIARPLQNGTVDSHLARQVVRSVTSSGANYEEACSAESRADFIDKLQISLKELNETLYWLRLIEKIDRKSLGPELLKLIQENKELCAILARSVLTAKKHARG